MSDVDEPESDIRDRLRKWAAAHLVDGANEMFSPPPNHLTKRDLAAALLEHLPGSDGALTPGAIGAEKERRQQSIDAFYAYYLDRPARDAEHAAWLAANPAGTRERPICVEAVRRCCLVRTDANEWAVVDHGGWTEEPGQGVNSFTMGYMGGGDWYPDEATARAAFALASGNVDRGALLQLVAEHADDLKPAAGS